MRGFPKSTDVLVHKQNIVRSFTRREPHLYSPVARLCELPQPPCLPPRACSLPAPTPTPVRSTRARTFCGHVPKRLAQRPTCWPPRIEHNRALFVCHAASKGAALPPPPCPTLQAARARFVGGTQQCLGGAAVATGLGCRALPDARSNGRLSKHLRARPPCRPHSTTYRPPTCPREDLCFADEPHTKTPPSFGCLNVVSFPVGAPTFSRNLVPRGCSTFSRNPPTYSWSRTACRSASLADTDVTMTERNFGTCSRPVGKLRSVSKAWPQPQTANIKLGCSRVRATKRRTQKTTARPFKRLAKKPGSKMKRASQLAPPLLFALKRWVSTWEGPLALDRT